MKTAFNIIAAALIGLVIYVLSDGPAVYTVYRLRSDELDEVRHVFYRPLFWATEAAPESLKEMRFHYYVWWAEMARRHRGDPMGPAT